MKKYAWLLLIPFLMAAKPYKGDRITVADKAQSPINTFIIEKVEIYPQKEVIKILVKYGSLDGKVFTAKINKGIVLKDKDDIPSTPRNEKKSDYTRFMQGNGINMRKLENFIKSELGE